MTQEQKSLEQLKHLVITHADKEKSQNNGKSFRLLYCLKDLAMLGGRSPDPLPGPMGLKKKLANWKTQRNDVA